MRAIANVSVALLQRFSVEGVRRGAEIQPTLYQSNPALLGLHLFGGAPLSNLHKGTYRIAVASISFI